MSVTDHEAAIRRMLPQARNSGSQYDLGVAEALAALDALVGLLQQAERRERAPFGTGVADWKRAEAAVARAERAEQRAETAEQERDEAVEAMRAIQRKYVRTDKA